MGKPTGFMEEKREKPAERDPLTRLKDWKEYSAPFSDEASKRQGARCMDCGTPFCQIGADINGFTSGRLIYNLIPEWNDLVYRGRWKEALERLLKTNNFPEFTGRVCPAPCEGSCTLAISDPAVSIKNIERTIIDKGFENGWIQPRIPAKRTGKKVAVVGSGPAGLASADQLNQAGHSVTVYERADRAGGLLMYGIPSMKLEKNVVERRIKLLTQEGIDFVTNTEIGVDITADELKEQFDAVILCTGAQKRRNLLIEGREAKGVHYAMDYLTLATKSYLDSNFKDKQFIDAKGKDVIVIGGGDTGADCVATAARQKRAVCTSSGNILNFLRRARTTICGLNSRTSLPLNTPMKKRRQSSAKTRENIQFRRQKWWPISRAAYKRFTPFKWKKSETNSESMNFMNCPGQKKYGLLSWCSSPSVLKGQNSHY